MSGPSLARSHRKRIEVPVLLVGASVSLFQGLSLPLIRVEKAIFLRNEYSVWKGVVGLRDDGQWFLAALVFFFSFVFPIAKLLLVSWIWFGPASAELRRRTLRWLEELGRWSMLDVFVVAILIVATKLGPLSRVEYGVGVYWFAAAILASMIVTRRVRGLAASS